MDQSRFSAEFSLTFVDSRAFIRSTPIPESSTLAPECSATCSKMNCNRNTDSLSAIGLSRSHFQQSADGLPVAAPVNFPTATARSKTSSSALMLFLPTGRSFTPADTHGSQPGPTSRNSLWVPKEPSASSPALDCGLVRWPLRITAARGRFLRSKPVQMRAAGSFNAASLQLPCVSTMLPRPTATGERATSLYYWPLTKATRQLSTRQRPSQQKSVRRVRHSIPNSSRNGLATATT
ncbi:unannotated protein [freshwater metagenome]|uniref:Unannotated protein n=1 Tax=freshwater metagenome TaxID=449393 RepID=A0A6J6BT33_9ZZZZ